MKDIFGSFFLNGSEFALSVSNVREVVNPPDRFIPVPLAPDFLKGLFNLRGSVIPVLDLRLIMGLPIESATAEGKIVILERDGLLIGLMFDQTGEIFRSTPEERNDFKQSENGVISGVFKRDHGKRLVQIVDALALLRLKNVPLTSELEKGNSRRQKIESSKGVRKQCISFHVGASQCALNMDSIQEILRIEKVDESALAHEKCLGTIDLRGMTVPVVDFVAMMGGRNKPLKGSSLSGDQRVIVMKIGRELFGLLVDAVDNIVAYFKEELLPFPGITPEQKNLFAGCIARTGCDEILLLDQAKVLTDDQILEVTRGHSKLYEASVERQQQTKNDGQRKTYITFSIDAKFALEIKDVQEIIERPENLLKPPSLPAHFRGLLNRRGEMVTIVDARAMYGKPASLKASESKILIIRKQDVLFGLLVDSVDTIVSVFEKEIIPIPELIFRDQMNSMKGDILQAVEFGPGNGQRECVLILNPSSVATRIGGSAAA